VKFGIGRYLYSLDPQWRDWNPQSKTFGKAPPAPKQATVDRNGYPAGSEPGRPTVGDAAGLSSAFF